VEQEGGAIGLLPPKDKNMQEYYSILRPEHNSKGKFTRWVTVVVEGEIVDTVFGIRAEGDGWRITHIPTKCLLVDTYFETFEGAKKFAKMTIKLYGELLDTHKITVFRDVRKQKEEYRQFHELMGKMNDFEGVLSISELGKL